MCYKLMKSHAFSGGWQPELNTSKVGSGGVWCGHTGPRAPPASRFSGLGSVLGRMGLANP